MNDRNTVFTNYNKRPVFYWNRLTPKEQEQFIYLTPEERIQSARFVRYLGKVIDLDKVVLFRYGEFPDFWDGYFPDTAFSGFLVHYIGGSDCVIMGHYWSL